MPSRPSSAPKEASPLRVVQAALQSRTFAPVYYFFGDDDFLKDAAVRDLLAGAIDPATRDFNCEIRRAGELDAEEVSTLLAMPPMLAERRAVVLRDVGSLKKAARQQLDQYLSRPASDTLLLLVTPASSKADDTLRQHSVPLEFDTLSPERVRKWIGHQLSTAHAMQIADDATQLLQQAVGNDLHLLAAELDKCVSYVRGTQDDPDTTATIDVETVAAVVGVRRGETMTDLLDAVAAQDAAHAIALVDHVLSQPKVTAVQAVMMLTTQALALSFGRARRDSGVPTNRLPQEFFTFLKDNKGYPGRPWGEAASLWTKVTERWSARSCERALELLLEADMQLKDSTVSDANRILSSLVLSLCAMGARPARLAAALLACAMITLSAPSGARAQPAPAHASAAVVSTIDRARSLADGGNGPGARRVLDSVVAAVALSADDLAEALYWRAVLSERAADAEMDWKRLIIEAPLSPRTPDALLRLAEAELARGDARDARVHLEHLVRDFVGVEQRPKAIILIGRSYFDARDVTRACGALASLNAAEVPPGELQLQADELRGRCAKAQAAAAAVTTPVTLPTAAHTMDTASTSGRAASAAAAPPATGAPVIKPVAPTTSPGPTSTSVARAPVDPTPIARYSVQIAAYDTHAKAATIVAGLTKRGIKAHVDGDRKPFRVRIGSYATRDEAATALAKMKKQGQSGFVTESGK